MRRTQICIAVVFGAALGTAANAADFAFDDYKPSTLKDVFAIGENECGPLETYTMAVVAGKQAFRVPAIWNGDVRPMNQDTRSILYLHEHMKGRSFGVPIQDLYKNEVRVTDRGREFWLPIQEPTIAAFRAEVGPVKHVTLYVLYFGCKVRQDRGVDVAVTISEFDATQ